MLIYTESLQQQIFNLQQSIIVVAKEPLEIKSNSVCVFPQLGTALIKQPLQMYIFTAVRILWIFFLLSLLHKMI